MRDQRWSTGIGVLLLGLSLALVPITAASASKPKATHHKPKPKPKSSPKISTKCPKQAVISSATGTTFTGPSKNNFGTAACIYSNAAGDALNVVYMTPNESRSQFVTTDPGDIGKPAQVLSGVGAAAFSTTTYGHAEASVYLSSSQGFGVTLDPANGAAVTSADLAAVVAVAKAIAGGK